MVASAPIKRYHAAKMSQVLFLSLEDVVAAGGTKMAAAIADVKQGIALEDAGKIISPPKTTLREGGVSDDAVQGFVNILPAAIFDEPGIIGAKLIGSMNSNHRLGMPRASGVIALFDRASKQPIAILDAQVISAMRTGAVSALMAESLVPNDLEAVGLIGAGVNMRTQLLGISHVRPNIRQVAVYSRGESKNRFAKEMGARLGLEIVPHSSAESAVQGQRFVISCIAIAPEPVVAAQWLAPGLTYFNIGGIELEPAALSKMDMIVSDNWSIAKHRSGQSHSVAFERGILDDSQVQEMAPIVLGRRRGRTSPRQSIFFSPTGLGYFDILMARRIYYAAKSRRIGQYLTLSQDADWI